MGSLATVRCWGEASRPPRMGRRPTHPPGIPFHEECTVALSPSDVARLAALARIELTDDELTTLAPQLDVILESVTSVASLAGDDVEPSSHALPLTNVFRADEVRTSLSAEQALSGAPDSTDGRFRVPRILDEEA